MAEDHPKATPAEAPQQSEVDKPAAPEPQEDTATVRPFFPKVSYTSRLETLFPIKGDREDDA